MTAEPAILDGAFWDLGDEAMTDITYREQELPTVLRPAEVLIPQVEGRPVGPVTNGTVTVKMVQLVLAPHEDLLYPNFPFDHPELHRDFAGLCLAIDQLGPNAPPLHVLPIPRTVMLQGKAEPMYAVYHNPIHFLAMQHNRRAEAAVIIELGKHPGQILMQSLSEVKHTLRPSVLDECDVAARLAGYGFDQPTIAIQMANDAETNQRVDQATISRMIAITRLPTEVRHLIRDGRITRSHAELLAVSRLMGEPEQQTLLALWVAQSNRSVRQLEWAISLCFPDGGKPQGHLIVHDNGGVEVIDETLGISLQSDRVARALAYPTMTPTRPDEISRMVVQAYKGARVQVRNGEVLVDPEAFNGIMNWAKGAGKRAISLHEAEVMAYAFVEALRQDARQRNLLTRSGQIAPTLPKESITSP